MQFNAVVESNRALVELYQRLGFAVVGTVPGAFAHPTLGRVALHVMHKSCGSGLQLAAPAAAQHFPGQEVGPPVHPYPRRQAGGVAVRRDGPPRRRLARSINGHDT